MAQKGDGSGSVLSEDETRKVSENWAPIEDLSEDQISEFLRTNGISLEGEEEDVISDLMVLGNAKLLENFINNSAEKDKLKIEEVLPKIYEEIQLLNVPLPSSMSLFVESHIINSRLFSNKKLITDENHVKICDDESEVENIDDNIAKRINLVIDFIENLEKINSTFSSENEMSDGFLFVGKFIARNMEILKNQLRFCCTKLPWTEMQFCLIDFISRPKNMNFISSLILNRTRLMAHLAHFKSHLEILKSELKFDRKIKFDKRKDSIAFVLQLNPGFRSLYEDYEVLRDVYSLNRIESHLNAAAALDLEQEDALVSEQMILRALQVTGECLKNTEDSPNMSDNVHRSLMAMAPSNIKDIVTSLRDSLSHVDHLHKVKNMEDRWNLLKDHPEIQNFLPETKNFLLETKNFLPDTKNFLPDTKNFLPETKNSIPDIQKFFPDIQNSFPDIQNSFFDIQNSFPDNQNSFLDAQKDRKWLSGIQKDVMKLKYEITFQLSLKKDLAIKTFFRRIFECECIKNAKEIIGGIPLKEVETELNENGHVIIHELVELCEKFKEVVKISSDYQRDYLQNLEFVMELLKSRWTKLNRKHVENVQDVQSFITSVQDGGEMDLIRRKAGSLLGKANLEWKNNSNLFEEVLTNVSAIYNSLERAERYSHDQLYSQIFDLIEFEAKRAQSIDQLNREMEKKLIFEDDSEMMKKSEEKVNEILKEIVENNEIGDELLVQIDNKKELYRSKNQLIDYYSKIIQIYENVYDNCVDIYNALINSIELLCSCNNPEISDFNKNQSLIKLIEENQFGQLLLELNLKNLINEKEFKTLLEKIKSREFTTIEEIILNKKSQFDKLLLIDGEIFNYNGEKILINFKKVFDIFLKNNNNKIDIIEKGGKNRKKDEAQVAKLIDKNELTFVINKIKLDLSIDEDRFNLPAVAKALNLSSETFILNDFSLSNCKSLKQNLQKSDSYGKLVKEAANEPDMTKLSQPFKKFFQFLNFQLKPEIDLAVEKAFQKMENQRKIGLKNYFFQKFEILSKIFPIEKSDLDLLNLINSNLNIRLSVEILVLNLTETLENLSYFDSNNRFYLDEVSPVLVGKSLRNYLAHGDPLINILSTNYHISLINHFRLFERLISSKDDFYSGQFLIGKTTQENLFKIAEHYNHNRSILVKKFELTNITKNTEIENFKELIDNPKYLNVRDALGDTLLHYSAFADNLSVFRHLFERGLSAFVNNENNYTPIKVAIDTGSEAIIKYLLDNGFDSSFIVDNSETLLHLAVQFGHLNIVQLLLDRNADLEAVNNEGNTPIFYAVFYKHRNILDVLLRAGSDVGRKGKNGKSLAHLANAEILKVLLEKNVDLSALDHDLNTPLHSACYEGNEDVVKLLLDNRVDVINKNKDGVSPIHFATSQGHLKIVQLLLEKNIQLVNTKTSKQSTPLYFACLHGHLDIVSFLLSKGADVNAKCVEDMTALHVATSMGHLHMMDILLDSDKLTIDSFSHGMTALNFAAKGGQLEAFKKLVARGANISLPTKGQLSALHLAAFAENLDLMKYILEKDSELIESVDSRGQTALHDCALYNKINSLNFLIANGANLEARDCAGNTPLLTSAFKGHADIFLILTKHGASLEVKNKDNWSVVHCAAQNNNITIMKELMKRQLNLNAQVDNDFTAVHFASQNGHSEMVKLLVENGADLGLRNFNDWSALHFAALNDHLPIIRYLVTKERQLVNALTADDVTPLHLTAKNGNVSAVTLLIENGADIYAETASEWTALHFAAEKGHSKIIETLLNSTESQVIVGVESGHYCSVSDFVNAKNNSGWTASHLSARNGHFEALKTLLKHEALVNIGDNNNHTALHWATESGHSSCVRLLIDNGADINAKNNRQCTPLHFAAEDGRSEIVKILLNEVAEIDCKTDLHVTPLHVSAQNGHVEVVQLLLERNPDINALDSNRYTPLHYASSKGHHPIVDLLLRKHALTDLLDRDGFSALHIAAKDGHKLVVETIISGNIDTIDLPTEEDSMTALHFAAGNNHFDVLEFLLDNRANINAKTNTNWTALHFAVEKGHSKIVEILLRKGARFNSSLLHLAIEKNDVSLANILINNGADINAINDDESTGLHVACGTGNLIMAELLVKFGAETNCKARCGLTPLHMAAFNGHLHIAQFLLSHGALVNERMEGGCTALHWVVKHGHANVVDTLLSFEADANAADETLETPLHIAVGLNLMEVAEKLIRVGRADVLARDGHDTVLHKAVLHEEMLQMILNTIEKRTETEVELRKKVLNATDNEGDSPLMWAAEYGLVGAVRLLLMASGEEALLDVDMRNMKGNTALHWAALKGHWEMVEVLVLEGKAKTEVRNSEGESAFDLAKKRINNDEQYESIAAFLLSFAP